MKSLLLLAVFVAMSALGGPLPTLTWDGIPWSYPAQERVVAVGDVHGDFEALVAILRDRGLVDENGGWTGGKAHLVMMGDLNDRGTGTRRIFDYLMALEKSAAKNGGMVHTLVGNHEETLIQGLTRFLSQEDIQSFLEFLPVMPREEARRAMVRGETLSRSFFGLGMVNAVRGDTVYAKWIRSHNTMVKIGDTLFVHAGVEDWALSVDPGDVNATVRRWLEYYQGVGPRPDEGTVWTMGHTKEKSPYRDSSFEGPLWTAVFSLDPRENRGRKVDLKNILEKLGVKRVVVGHIMTPDHRVLLSHPRFGSGVVMIDTAISRGYPDGQWSAIEIRDGEVTAHYAKRPEAAPTETPRKPFKRCLDSFLEFLD